MRKDRLLAFSDGVFAIIITIMVLELKAPHTASWDDLLKLSPIFVSYVLSYIYIAIYWNNHHHMLEPVHRINGASLWANMFLLFWLSLVPFATAWMGETQFAKIPTALYGVTLLMPAVAYTILQRVLIAARRRQRRQRQDLDCRLRRRHRGRADQSVDCGVAICVRRRDLAGPGSPDRTYAG
jgi:uncharacterized membrane protein